MMGAVGGFFLGCLIWTVFETTFGMESQFFMAVLAGVSATICSYCFIHYDKQSRLISMCLLGSYFFMRGCSYYVGGFPSEYELFTGRKLNGDDLEIVWFYWIYLGVFVTCAVLSYIW
jgi:hypothetical protein